MATTAATSSTSNAATDAQTAAAAKRASAQKIITSLSAGSGVDVAALAQGLVDAERVPKEGVINSKITKNEARVSGYSAVKFMLSNVKDALTALKDANSFNTASVNNSNTSALSVTASTAAGIGSHAVSITTLASAQRNVSTGFAASSTSLNAGSGFTMDLTIGSDAAATMAGAVSTSTAAVSGLTINGTAIDAVSADPTIVTTTGAAGQTESSVITFSALGAGQKATLNGLTFTATAAMTADEVASAFGGLSSGDTDGNTTGAALGTYSGTFTDGFTTDDWTSGATVTATSTTAESDVTDIAITAQKFDNLAIAINAKSGTTGVSAVNTSGSVALSGGHINLGTTANSTAAITGISGTVVSSAVTITVADGYDTPQGLVNAINTADLAVTARLVNTGSSASPSYKVVLTGETGADAAFSISTDPDSVLTTLGFTETAAVDAVLTVDGVSYTRSSNSVTDVIDGVTLNLLSASTTASVSLARDTTQLVEKIDALVTAYNEANSLFTEVANPKSSLDIYGATLVGDTTVRMVRTQLREALLGESSTPGTNVTAAWQMGLSVDKAGVMTLDKTKLVTALEDNFDDVVTTFTANQNNRSATSPPYSSSTGYTSGTTSLNGGAAFTVTLTSTDGTAHGFPVTAANATPQGVVDAINATSLGYTAQLVQETSGTTPYKIVILGSIAGSGFTLEATDSDGDTVSDISFSSSGSGIAGDALRKITTWLATTSPLTTQSVNAESQNAKYADALAALQTRMDDLLARYTKQFSAMESLVGSVNSQKTSLKSTFEGMMSMYTNN